MQARLRDRQCKGMANRADATEGRKRDMTKDEMLHDSLGETEGKSYRIISKIQGLWRSKNDFNQRMEYLGVRGDERVRLVMSNIDGRGRQEEAGRRSR